MIFNLLKSLVRETILGKHQFTKIPGSNMKMRTQIPSRNHLIVITRSNLWAFNTLEHGIQIKP